MRAVKPTTNGVSLGYWQLKSEIRSTGSRTRCGPAECPTHDYDEATTRTEFVDADLLESGWMLDQPKDRRAATAVFAQFLDGKTATANHIQFVRLIVDRFTQDSSMAPAMLFEPPFTNNAPQCVTSLFDNGEARRIVAVIDQLNVTADAS